jgi:hypothetical protein
MTAADIPHQTGRQAVLNRLRLRHPLEVDARAAVGLLAASLAARLRGLSAGILT